MSSINPQKRGDTWNFEVGPIKRKGAIVDLNGASLWMTVKADLDDPDPGLAQITEVSSASGIAVADIATGIISGTFSDSVTGLPLGTYWIDCQVVEADGTKKTQGPHRFTVRNDATKA